jgi:hypothetical protein
MAVAALCLNVSSSESAQTILSTVFENAVSNAILMKN